LGKCSLRRDLPDDHLLDLRLLPYLSLIRALGPVGSFDLLLAFYLILSIS
jgi:hypothetical protein